MRLIPCIVALSSIAAVSADPAASPNSDDFSGIRIDKIVARSGINAPQRVPTISLDAAIARATEFFHQQLPSAPEYYLCSARWFSYTDRPGEDCWIVEWAASDPATKPAMRMILVFSNRVIFGGYA